jgi:hypothetical protein
VQELSRDELDEFLEFCAEKALVSADSGNGSQTTLFSDLPSFRES